MGACAFAWEQACACLDGGLGFSVDLHGLGCASGGHPTGVRLVSERPHARTHASARSDARRWAAAARRRAGEGGERTLELVVLEGVDAHADALVADAQGQLPQAAAGVVALGELRDDLVDAVISGAAACGRESASAEGERTPQGRRRRADAPQAAETMSGR